MSKPKNPLAFPRPGFDTPAGYEDGMSLRDYFAGQALVGVIFDQASWGEDQNKAAPEFACSAYDIADEMMAERERRQ